jgi:hypothetical protein
MHTRLITDIGVGTPSLRESGSTTLPHRGLTLRPDAGDGALAESVSAVRVGALRAGRAGAEALFCQQFYREAREGLYLLEFAGGPLGPLPAAAWT